MPRGYDAVAGEIERQTPFAPDQVYLGYHVEDAIDPRGRVTAHLAQFELSGRTLALQGVAHAAPDLIAPLEALDQVAKVEFTVPTLRDPVQGLEQSQLTIQLRTASVAEQTE